MPELPEVETVLRAIAPALQNQRIEQIHIRTPRLRWEIDPNLPQKLANQRIITIFRRAKYLIFACERGYLLLHLGMSGSVKILPKNTAPKPQKHEHFDLQSEDFILRYRDPRKFGAIVYSEQAPQTHPLLKNLGVEPLSEDFNADYLFQACQRRASSIKQVLMHNPIVVGIGNIYANEALFFAKIHPETPANRLNFAQCARLVLEVQALLQRAIAAGGSSIQDFSRPDGQSAYFQFAHQVYQRAGKACPNCGSTIESRKQHGRSSFFCPACQPKIA